MTENSLYTVIPARMMTVDDESLDEDEQRSRIANRSSNPSAEKEVESVLARNTRKEHRETGQATRKNTNRDEEVQMEDGTLF